MNIKKIIRRVLGLGLVFFIAGLIAHGFVVNPGMTFAALVLLAGTIVAIVAVFAFGLWLIEDDAK